MLSPDVSSLPVDDTIHEVTSEGPGPTWRAIRYPVDLIVGWDSPAGPHIVPGVATLALPMDAARNSLQRLITLQVLVGLIILTLAGGLSWLLVNSALAPLQKSKMPPPTSPLETIRAASHSPATTPRWNLLATPSTGWPRKYKTPLRRGRLPRIERASTKAVCGALWETPHMSSAPH
ncbi:MAG: hypothetical protein U1U88_001847 [Lawsonella clevelandensis]